jgi:hypothetical protein
MEDFILRVKLANRLNRINNDRLSKSPASLLTEETRDN